MSRRNTCEVYLKSVVVCIVLYVAIGGVDSGLQTKFHNRLLCWAAASAIVQTSAVLLLSAYLMALRICTRLKEGIYGQIRPAILDRVLALAFEGESWSSGVPKRGPARRTLEESVAHALNVLKGSARDRVARFADECGFVAEWVKAFSSHSHASRKRAMTLLALSSPDGLGKVLSNALEDKHAGVRREAFRSLLARGNGEEVESVFRFVLRESLLTRALLCDDLKRHAPYLLEDTVPSVLRKGSRVEIARCFEILISWKRALPSFNIRPWLSEHSDRLVWPLVLTLLPYVPVDHAVEEHLACALKAPEIEIRRAAAQAAGHLKLQRLIPELSSALSQDRRLAVASAMAIAHMGEPGERHLETIVIGSDQKAAAAAMEALEHITVKS